ncbi:MAG: tetratricopeptide repeat protein [Terriglobales bacterium]
MSLTRHERVARWKSEAERGDASAQFWLGVAYERGKGVEQDFAQALRWSAESAKQGNADAQNMLGQMYEDAEGVSRDYIQAAKWCRAACENRPDYGGAGQGCNNLGLLYLDGNGVRRNRVEAYKYFKLSGSAVNLDIVKRTMTPDEVAEAEDRTEQWVRVILTNSCVVGKNRHFTHGAVLSSANLAAGSTRGASRYEY